MTTKIMKCSFVTALGFTGSATFGVVSALSKNPIRAHMPETSSSMATAQSNLHKSFPTLADDGEEYDNKGNNGRLSGGASPLLSMQNRKQALYSISSAFAVATAGVVSSTVFPPAASAFDRTFPVELTDIDDNKSGNSGVLIGQRSNSQQRKQNAELTKKKLDQNLATFNVKNDLLPSATWGLALFFASGSRSNPLATPLANLLYDKKKEKWLEDRNAGLFSAPPLPFLVLLGFVFLILGTATQYVLLQLAEGDSGVCGQLAGVSLIGGGFFEIGRIASGEKRMTRDEKDRAVQLNEEFNEFAENRLKPGGNCHRTDIVKSFRRYYAKYRQSDSQEYPLTDLEIEKLLRFWNQKKNQGKAEMSSSGFYYGIQINADADVFA